MTSAAADVINHNGLKIGRFKPIRFCYVRMTSAQSWSWHHHWFEPTSSLPIFKGLYLVIYKTLALIIPVQLKECKELYLCKNPSRNIHVYPTKLSRFESTDFTSVMIDDVGCSRRHQCPRCDQQAWYWLWRTDNTYCCSRVNFMYLGWARSKILFKMWVYLL